MAKKINKKKYWKKITFENIRLKFGTREWTEIPALLTFEWKNSVANGARSRTKKKIMCYYEFSILYRICSKLVYFWSFENDICTKFLNLYQSECDQVPNSSKTSVFNLWEIPSKWHWSVTYFSESLSIWVFFNVQVQKIFVFEPNAWWSLNRKFDPFSELLQSEKQFYIIFITLDFL